MQMGYDGYGGIEIIGENTAITLDWDECAKLAALAYDGLCKVCGEEINEGSHLCCDCFNGERRWHAVHCETTGAHR